VSEFDEMPAIDDSSSRKNFQAAVLKYSPIAELANSIYIS
jgi:hypothetical protein